jgi:transposase-like protein
MSKSRHTEAEMIAALKQVEAGRKVEDVAREVGVSKHTISCWLAPQTFALVPSPRERVNSGFD